MNRTPRPQDNDPRKRAAQDGRDEQRNLVADILAESRRPLTRQARARIAWNPVLGWVEVR